jgi:hypothetical protein
VGSNIVSVDPRTRQATTVYSAPQKEADLPRYEIPTGLDILGKPTTTARLTLPEMEAMSPNLPDKIRTNAPFSTYMAMANQGRTNQPAAGQIRPGQRGLLPRDLKAQYLQAAQGDKALAEELAQRDGYQTRY